MARPIKSRIVCSNPKVSTFAPLNSNYELSYVIMSVEEFETIRLIDYENKTQEECAKMMEVARTTIQKIYDDARKKLADVLVNGKSLKIEGGNYDLCSRSNLGYGCKRKICRRLRR